MLILPILFSVLVGLAPVLVVLNSIRVNRKWRQIVECENGIGEKEPKSITQKSMISLLIAALAANVVLVILVVRISL